MYFEIYDAQLMADLFQIFPRDTYSKARYGLRQQCVYGLDGEESERSTYMTVRPVAKGLLPWLGSALCLHCRLFAAAPLLLCCNTLVLTRFGSLSAFKFGKLIPSAPSRQTTRMRTYASSFDCILLVTTAVCSERSSKYGVYQFYFSEKTIILKS